MLRSPRDHFRPSPKVPPPVPITWSLRSLEPPLEEALKEYRDEAMKHLEAAEHAEPQESAVEVNAAIASSLIDIAETLHAIRASLDKLAA